MPRKMATWICRFRRSNFIRIGFLLAENKPLIRIMIKSHSYTELGAPIRLERSPSSRLGSRWQLNHAANDIYAIYSYLREAMRNPV